MKKALIVAVLTLSIFASAMAARVSSAHATAAVYANYCWGYEWGTIKQSASGNWYRCTWTGNGYTGFQWWGLY